mgnify:CR=1 FL=1
MNPKVKRLQDAAVRAKAHSREMNEEANEAARAKNEAEALLTEQARVALFTRLPNKAAFEAEWSKRIAALDAARARLAEARSAANAAADAWNGAANLARACEAEAARMAKETTR